MGRIRKAAEQVNETASLAEQVLSEVATNGLRLSGTLRLFEPPKWLAEFWPDAGEVKFDLTIRIPDSTPQAE